MDQSFGSWVKRRRKTLDLTQQKLAWLVGCSLATIVKIEADERRPSHQVAALLAQHLGIPPDQRDLFLKIARQEKGIFHLDSLPPLSALPPTPVTQPHPSSLPVPATPLVGREPESAMILQQLQNPACRLLTLTGPGGVGKTRLALETAHKLGEVFRDGVYFVSLAGTASSEYIPPAIAESLGYTFSRSNNAQAQLCQYLKGRHILLLLDNLEHLLQDIGLLSELLECAPDVKILATSREQLNLRVEWTFAMQGLPIPSSADLETLESNSAAALFLQRAERAKLDFIPSADDLSSIRRICQLVEGLPLGLELAASWVRTISCREIAQEIENNMDFLSASARDVPPRHRSMRAVFDYSWSLLSRPEQEVLMKLSVFRGGFTRDAAEQVAGASLLSLSTLVDKSLVWKSREKRFEIHELIRQYAYEQLGKAGEQEETCSRHFAFFLGLAEESRLKLHGTEQIQWLNRLEEDHDNLRAALAWSLRYQGVSENPSPEQHKAFRESFQLAGALYLFWWRRNHWSEGRAWLQRILDQPAEPAASFEFFRALNAATVLAVEQADHRSGLQLAGKSLALAEQLEDPSLLAYAHLALGSVFWKLKDYVCAQDHCKQALELFRRLGTRLATASALQTLGRIAMNQNQLDLAQVYLDECVEIFQEFGNTIEFNAALSDRGLLAYLRRDYSSARLYNERSLKLFQEAGNKAGIEMSLNRLGDLARCGNEYEEAARLYSEAMEVYRETGDKDEIASLLHNLGYVAKQRGDTHEALALFREALSMQVELDNRAGIAECLSGIAGIFAIHGDEERAGRLFGTAETLREAAGVVLWPANQIEYERSLACLRQSIGEDELAAAWEQGRLLLVARAVGVAMDRR
jgi:predicted ATPase/transcriptional regulator with XRE-family HTH domain/Tfp pilus assembly protein PilF